MTARLTRGATRRDESALSPQDIDIADRLLAWARAWFGARTIKDVFVWRVGPEVRFALNGPAAAMLARMGFDYLRAPLDNHYGRFDFNLARAFGRTTRWMGSYSEPSITHLSGTFGVGEMLGGVGGFIKQVRDDYETPLDLTIIPEPGYPWAGPGTRYYSAREKKTILAKKPSWVVPVVVRDRNTELDVTRPGADWCQLAPRSEPAESGAGYFTLPSGAGHAESVFVTHTIDLRPSYDNAASARAILRCKGMLFPSLAVAPIPASNFGPCTLVADPMLVLRELKPYRAPRQGMPQVVTYNTDAWTDTTRTFVSELSARLYDQLTGNADSDDYTLGETHLYILGPKAEEADTGGFRPSGMKPIASTPQLARELKARFRIWHGPMNAREFGKASERAASGMARYGYLEAKAHTIVPMGAFVAAWAPDFAALDYTSFLRSAGYKGRVYTVTTTSEERAVFSRESVDQSADLVRYNYAWKMADAMRQALTPRSLLL